MSGELLPALPVVGAALGLLIGRGVHRWIGERHGQARVSDLVPWSHVDADGETVWLTAGGAFRVMELSGTVYAGRTNAAVEAALANRERFFRAQRRAPVRMRIVSRRFPIVLDEPPHRPGFLGRLNRAWHEQVREAHHSSHHVILSVEKNEHVSRLDEAQRNIESMLTDFGPRRLRNVASKALQGASPLLSFLAELVTEQPAFVPPTTRLHEAVSVASLAFSPDGRVEASDGLRKRVVQVFTVRLWGERTDPEVIRKVLSLRWPVSLCLHMRTMDQMEVQRVAKKRRKQALINVTGIKDERKRAEEEDAVSYISQEWAETVKELVGEKTALHQTDAVLMVTTPEDEVAQAATDLRQLLGPRGVVVVAEEQMAERVYWSRLPGYDYFSRDYTVRSQNLADLTPWEAEPRGRNRCSWGNHALRSIPNAGSRSPYSFVPHVHDGPQAPAHMCVFGPTGRGKTTALAFLLSGALSAYPDLRALAFDRNLGLRVLTHAMGGNYLDPASDELPLNPLDVDDDKEGRARKRAELLVQLLAGVDDAESVRDISQGVDALFRLPRRQRTLAGGLREAFRPGPVRTGLEPWCEGSGRYARIFNAERDAFAPGAARLTTVAMDSLEGDERLSGALSFYLAQRTADELAGIPHIIWIDEAGTLLRMDQFAARVETFLRDERRQEGSVWLTFQEVGALNPLSIASTVRVNCETMLFWPGTAKEEHELEPYGLTEEERSFVLGRERLFEDAAYPVLLKRSDESVFLDFDLSGIGPLLRVFAGGTTPSLRMKKAVQEAGDKWLDTYLAL